MSHRSTRRGFLAVALAGTAALPVIGAAGTASAAGPSGLATATFPEHPAADYGDGSFDEPLNAGVDCARQRRAA